MEIKVALDQRLASAELALLVSAAAATAEIREVHQTNAGGQITKVQSLA